MERITYPLRHPIPTVLDGPDGAKATITELKLAPRVKGRHMKATDKANGPVEAKLLLIASLAGIGRAEAEELDEEDILAIDGLYADDTDLQAIARQLGLSATVQLVEVHAAIGALLAASRGSLDVPLDGGAGRSADGPATGATSPET